MKPYRNIYTLFIEDPIFLTFKGELEIPYTGQIFYDVEELLDDFDENQDVYYRCHCDIEEFKGFKKV